MQRLAGFLVNYWYLSKVPERRAAGVGALPAARRASRRLLVLLEFCFLNVYDCSGKEQAARAEEEAAASGKCIGRLQRGAVYLLPVICYKIKRH